MMGSVGQRAAGSWQQDPGPTAWNGRLLPAAYCLGLRT